MSSPQEQPELSELSVRYLTGEAAEPELARLLAALREEEPAAGRAARLIAEDQTIAGWFRAEQTPEFVARAYAAVGIRQRDAVFVGKAMRRVRRAAAIPLRRRRPFPGFSWGVRLGLAAALLVIVGGVLFHSVPPLAGGVAALTAATGVVHVGREGQVQPAREGMALDRDTEIRTDPGAAATVRYAGEESRLDIAEASSLVLSGRLGKRVRLERGRLRADVAKQPDDARMTFETRHAQIVVTGTRLTVEVLAAATRVEVEEGRVRARNRLSGETVDLSAGHRALIGRETAVAVAPVTGHRPAEPARRAGLCALYTFEEGTGPRVRDVSGVGAPLDLWIADPAAVRRLPGGGLELRRPTIIASREPAAKIAAACRTSHELTVEVWIRPADTTQGVPVRDASGGILHTGPSRIVTLSRDFDNASFMLGQWAEQFHCRLRTTLTASNGCPALATRPGSVSAALTHVVYTREASGRARCYVNGADATRGATGVQYLDEAWPIREGPVTAAGDFAPWRPDSRLALGDEFSRSRHWLGEYYLVAVYSHAISAEEVGSLFRAGLRRARVARQ
ncbi:MAG: FecR domain-containing protein [Kiritimatiellae bacterium]|nr:FecR domain-containing protein [Kiritimatiellia bacterium]